MNTSFNMFTVLEKDNKELIHSAFLKFLMEQDNRFYTDFLGLNESYGKVVLEKQYSFTKQQKGRFDIEIQSNDGKSIIVVENKFKSFPYHEQFHLYDKILNKHHKNKKAYKFLICFDRYATGSFEGWQVKDYSDLLSYLKANYDLNAGNDTSVFVRHYYFFLNNYLEKYSILKKDFRSLFINLRDENNKFWLKLFYSHLKLRLDNYFLSIGIKMHVYINSGNTQIPLMNITPALWKVNGRELLIQFQGNDLKFYSHCSEKDFLYEIIEFSRKNMVCEHYEFKRLPKSQSKTYFILKTKVLQEMPNGVINVNSLFNVIVKFYQEIDQKVIYSFYNIN